jgi:asparagine synthase (glutamine-hydrolysing)
MTEFTPLELACGLVFGVDRPAVLPPVERTLTPAAALEAAILPALRRAPCLVSFSGGRDSSLVLAVATRLARREGLPDPIAASNLVPAAEASDESRWQELVVAHLGLGDWLRLRWDAEELDALGPFARRALRRHGLLWPFNAHFHVPLLEAAGGGSLLTGIGGDELFAAATRTGRRALLVPRALRRRRLERRPSVPFDWLTAPARRALVESAAASEVAEPLRLARRMAWVRGYRYLAVGTGSLELLARDAGATIAHPLLDPAAWAAVGRAPGRGFAGRTAAMRALFADLLPDELLARHTKASFDEVFFGSHSAAFARSWRGTGVPTEVVDVAALREHWATGAPRPQSLTLLQSAWLAESAREGLEEPARGDLERAPLLRPA